MCSIPERVGLATLQSRLKIRTYVRQEVFRYRFHPELRLHDQWHRVYAQRVVKLFSENLPSPVDEIDRKIDDDVLLPL